MINLMIMIKIIFNSIAYLFTFCVLIFVVDYKNPGWLDYSFLVIIILAVVAGILEYGLKKKYKYSNLNKEDKKT